MCITPHLVDMYIHSLRDKLDQGFWRPRIKTVRGVALPHEKSAFGYITKPPTIEMYSNSATRSPIRSCTFAIPTEDDIIRRLRQILHEATGGVAVVLKERFRVEPFQGSQTWEKE